MVERIELFHLPFYKKRCLPVQIGGFGSGSEGQRFREGPKKPLRRQCFV